VNDLCDGIAQCGDASDEDEFQCSRQLQIRLVGGPSQNGRIGRVEIRHKGVWGTVCDDHFNIEEAKVVCRMLGFPTENARVYNHTTDYQGDGPVWIRLTENSTCIGNESSISECKEKNLWAHDHYCRHVEDVAVSCDDEDLSFYSTSTLPPPLPEHPDQSGFDFELPQNSQTTPENDVLDQSRFDNMLSNEATHSLGGPMVDCGRQRINPFFNGRSDFDKFAPRIRAGSDSYCGEHPWQASIRVKGFEQDYHWCGATIISHFYLITAAHCLKDFGLSSYLIRVGDCNLDVLESEEAEYGIEEIKFHENFNVGPYLNNDIAIVKVRTNDSSGMAFGQYVSPVCCLHLI